VLKHNLLACQVRESAMDRPFFWLQVPRSRARAVGGWCGDGPFFYLDAEKLANIKGWPTKALPPEYLRPPRPTFDQISPAIRPLSYGVFVHTMRAVSGLM